VAQAVLLQFTGVWLLAVKCLATSGASGQKLPLRRPRRAPAVQASPDIQHEYTKRNSGQRRPIVIDRTSNDIGV
jgi:predicted small lipoprotein YifL